MCGSEPSIPDAIWNKTLLPRIICSSRSGERGSGVSRSSRPALCTERRPCSGRRRTPRSLSKPRSMARRDQPLGGEFRGDFCSPVCPPGFSRVARSWWALT
jgi:hypothetical protein